MGVIRNVTGQSLAGDAASTEVLLQDRESHCVDVCQQQIQTHCAQCFGERKANPVSCTGDQRDLSTLHFHVRWHL